MMVKNIGDYYHSLYEVAAVVNSARTPDDVLNRIVENVAESMGAKGCSLLLMTPDRKLLLHTASYGLSESYLRKGPISIDKRISEILEGKPVAISNVAEDERIQYREQAKREGIASILSVPMKLRDEVIGLISVYTDKPRHFTPDDIHFVGAVANLGAIALENAKLYESCQKDFEALRRDILQKRAAHDWIGGGVWALFRGGKEPKT